jgi:rhamnose utilization protein RhaD (predicted bifunctional aldolase and dehydrogenase)
MANAENRERRKLLVQLSHELGREDRSLAILAEGNTSARLSGGSFLVKSSGANLATISEQDVVECRAGPLLALLEKEDLSDAEVDDALLLSRIDPSSKKPSVEALFHSWLLTLPDIEFVGHTHPQAVNSILCSPRAYGFATRRLFPDEVVCCDVQSVFIPYTDPGLRLAQAIRKEVSVFVKNYNRPPRVILLANHGIITLGRSIEAVLTAMLMAEKAANIWLGAAALGGPVFMSDENVARIAKRPDEALRRNILKI